MRKLVAIAVMTMLAGTAAGCNDNSAPEDRTDASSLPEERPPEIDADPTPDTSTGGESQTTSPDGTVNGAPAAP